MRPLPHALALALVVPFAGGCEESPTVLEEGDGPAVASGFVMIVTGDPGGPNDSERALESRLRGLGRELVIRDDDEFETRLANGCGLVVVSKTVESDKLVGRLRPVTCAILFWEDNAQMPHMLATIYNDGAGGTGWHGTEDDVFVRPDAPADLRAGLSGEVDIYTSHDELTFAPEGDLVDDAIVVAEFDEAGGAPVIYALERGARLSDGSTAAGRRVYFGLYDDTFRLLTPEGLALFDAAVAWALR